MEKDLSTPFFEILQEILIVQKNITIQSEMGLQASYIEEEECTACFLLI